MTKIKMNEKRYKGYTLKVSLEKNCYRHLTFPGSFTLEDLADMILFAFDFDNDHLHAFFMDGQPYSRGESYYSRYAEEPGTPTNKIRVETLGLSEKQKFLFLFDFGDDWQFNCEIKKITDTPEKEPYISEIVGKAPAQYPDYGEYDDEPSGEQVTADPYFPLEPELYRSAFDFKQAKPWKKLTEEDVFAVKFTDGEVGYVTVVGSRGGAYGIALYLGNDGVSCLNGILSEPNLAGYDNVDLFEFELNQDCVMMTLKCKSDIEPEYAAEVQNYAKENGISLRGKNSFPYFVRYLPQRVVWSVENEKERKYLIQALDAATEFSKRLEDREKGEFRFGELPIIPLITKKKSGYSCGSAMLPKPAPKQYAPLKTALEFKKFRSRVNLECKIINLPGAVLNEKTGVPEYPVIMAFAETKSGYAMHTNVFPYVLDISSEMLYSVVTELSGNKFFPKTITVSDERTKALFSDICSRCGVELIVKSSLPVLDEIIRGLLNSML